MKTMSLLYGKAVYGGKSPPNKPRGWWGHFHAGGRLAGELVSPSTARYDRIRKVPLYAQYRVQYLWVVDPTARTFEAFRLKEGNGSLFASHADEDEKIRAEPFEAVELDLALLWG